MMEKDTVTSWANDLICTEYSRKSRIPFFSGNCDDVRKIHGYAQKNYYYYLKWPQDA